MSDETPRRRQCGTMQVHHRLLLSDPGYARRLARIEEQAFRARSGLVPMRPGCTLIPVVVHVVYKTAAQNVSMAQINSQIEVLNRDFRKTNADVTKTPAAFAPLAGDARIQFELAKSAPDGSTTDGVLRVHTNEDSFDSDDKVKFAAQGGSDAWPRDEYLNLWVCQLTGGLLGYAQFPGGAAETDGVVVTHTGFGTTGTAAAPFDLGRTATHEIGHWLNLRHIWGDDGDGCSGSDFVDDTPNQGGANVGKPTFPTVSCSNGPNGDMFMNYMDYVDDDSMVMFSSGQITRMHACLDGPRSAIGTAISCGGIAVPPKPIKEIVKDLPKEPFKDIIKEPFKEPPKDPPKELHKDPPKDFPKDPPKDFPKDPPKDFPKDPPKEFHKDPPKELFKDFAKDPIIDVGPQKPIFEIPFPDPKGFEPPFQFPNFPGLPGLPGIQTGPGPAIGQQPFVMATGKAPEPAAPPAQPLLAHYAQILQHYTGLHQRGLLDAQGLAAWQQALAAYRQLGGQ